MNLTQKLKMIFTLLSLILIVVFSFGLALIPLIFYGLSVSASYSKSSENVTRSGSTTTTIKKSWSTKVSAGGNRYLRLLTKIKIKAFVGVRHNFNFWLLKNYSNFEFFNSILYFSSCLSFSKSDSSNKLNKAYGLVRKYILGEHSRQAYPSPKIGNLIGEISSNYRAPYTNYFPDYNNNVEWIEPYVREVCSRMYRNPKFTNKDDFFTDRGTVRFVNKQLDSNVNHGIVVSRSGEIGYVQKDSFNHLLFRDGRPTKIQNSRQYNVIAYVT